MGFNLTPRNQSLQSDTIDLIHPHLFGKIESPCPCRRRGRWHIGWHLGHSYRAPHFGRIVFKSHPIFKGQTVNTLGGCTIYKLKKIKDQNDFWSTSTFLLEPPVFDTGKQAEIRIHWPYSNEIMAKRNSAGQKTAPQNAHLLSDMSWWKT